MSTMHNPDLIDPVPPENITTIPPALTGNTRDDDGLVIDESFEPNPDALPYEGLASETAEYERESAAPIGRLLSVSCTVGTDATPTTFQPVQLLPRDPNRKHLRIQFTGRVVITSDKVYSAEYAGVAVASSTVPTVVTLDDYTGALWVYAPPTVSADGLVFVTAIAVTE